MKKRIDEISMMKGLCILFVIAVHMVSLSGMTSSGTISTMGIPVMIVFYYLSGYNTSKKEISAADLIAKRVKRILLPYYKFAIPMLVILAFVYLVAERRPVLWFADGALGILFQLQSFHFFDTASQGVHPMFYCVLVGWFLFQMVVSELVFIPLLYFLDGKKNVWKPVISVILLTVGGILYQLDLQGLNGEFFPTVCKIFILPNIPGIAGLMLIGNYTASFSLLDPDNERIPKAVTSVLCLVITVIFVVTDDHLYDFPIGKWGAFGPISYIITPIASLAFFELLFILCNLLKRIPPARNILIHYGDNSMDYVMIHLFVAFLTAYIGGFWFEYLSVPNPTDDIRLIRIHYFILLVSVLIISYGVVRIDNHISMKRSEKKI